MSTSDLQLAITNEEKGSLIAFFYRIRFDKQFQEAFKKTGRDYDGESKTYEYKKQSDLPHPNHVVRLFELTETQERLIDELHDMELPEPIRDAKWAELMEGATKDVYKWTYQEKSIW